MLAFLNCTSFGKLDAGVRAGAGVDGTAGSPFEVYEFCLEGKIGLGLAKRPSLGTRLDGAEAAKLGATSLGSVYCESD